MIYSDLQKNDVDHKAISLTSVKKSVCKLPEIFDTCVDRFGYVHSLIRYILPSIYYVCNIN